MTAYASTATDQNIARNVEPVPTFPQDVVTEMFNWLGLKDGWDGARAPRPSPISVGRTVDIFGRWMRVAPRAKYQVAPALDGGVDVVFERGERWLSFYCRNDGVIEVERSDEETLEIPPARVNDQISWLLGK